MRNYKSKIIIPDNLLNQSIGKIGEDIFEIWYKRNFENEELHKQLQDREYNQIDFADWKGYTYQVKTTSEKTYTFNCLIDKLNEHLNADYYILIQLNIKERIAYVEDVYNKDYIKLNIKASFKYNNCFIWKKDLKQNKLEL